MTPLKLALLNLTRRKVPTIIAICAIAIAVACSGILLRINLLAESRFDAFAKAGDAIVGAKSGGIEIILSSLNGEGDYPGFLPYNLFESLKSGATVKFEDGAQLNSSGVKAIIPFLYFAKHKDYRIVATDDTFVRRPVQEDQIQFQEGGWSSGIDEIIVGSQVAKERGLRLGDSIPAQIWMGNKVFANKNLEFKVVGIMMPLKSSWDRMLFTNYQTAQKNLEGVNLTEASIWGSRVLNFYMVYLHPEGFESLQRLVNNRTVAQAILVEKEVRRLEDLVGVGKDLGLFVTVLILALGGLSVASMLITRFEAMTMQLAMLRAIGYQKSKLGSWLLWEGFLLGVSAVVIGMILDAAGFPIIRSLLGTSLPNSEMVGSSIFYSFPIWITAILATMLSVFIPLYRVYKQDVHFTLRG